MHVSHYPDNETSKQQRRLLIVDDDAAFCETLKLEFEDLGYVPKVAHSALEASRLLSDPIDFAIIDLRVGSDSGLEITRAIKTQWPLCRIVLLTGYGSIATAVQAIKFGASNYLTKPVSIEQMEKALWQEINEESSDTSKVSLARNEREYIEFVLTQCDGNITKAARWLGVHRQSLQRKLKKYSPSK